jgi:peptidoglycan/LPS O-acetylase OafA/YrhL
MGEQWHPLLALWPVYLGNFARFIAGTIAVDHIYTRFPAVPIEIGHFWSLAVEEQFYLLWPLVVFKVLERNKLIRVCVGVMAAVLLLRAALLFLVPASFNEMGFFFRMAFLQADAFLFGGLLALLLRGPHKERILRFGIWLLCGSIAAFALSCWFNGAGRYLSKFVPETPWVSAYGFTLVYLISGGLILCALRGGTILSRILSVAPLRLLGKYSYGFYVYHVLLAPVLGLYLGRSSAILAVSASLVVEFLIIFAISALSYHFLEQPFLRLKVYFSGAIKT